MELDEMKKRHRSKLEKVIQPSTYEEYLILMQNS
jgi:hypothetical protein